MSDEVNERVEAIARIFLEEMGPWLAEHDRQVAERAWDRCVGEMPIDPDWKNFYSDQNPYTKGGQK